jgi:signal transduction histidine kinase
MHENMPFVLELATDEIPNAGLSSNILLMQSIYIHAFLEFFTRELCNRPLMDLAQATTAFFQAVYNSEFGIYLQRDYTNDEKLFVFNTISAGNKRSEIESFDAYLRTSHIADQQGSFLTNARPAKEFLSDLIDDDEANTRIIHHLRNITSPVSNLDAIGTYDRSGIQICIIFASQPPTQHFAKEKIVSLILESLKNRYLQDHETANQFSSMRHELRPLLGDVRTRLTHVLDSYVTTPHDRKQKSDFEDTVSDIKKNLNKSLELTDAFGQADLFRPIQDPVLVTAEERAKVTSDYKALIPLLHRVKKSVDPKFRTKTRLAFSNLAAIFVKVDTENLVSILSKLLDNAHKYTPGGRSGFRPPEIRVNAEASSLAIIVENVGPRLENGEIGELFSKQFRGRRARRLGISGTGIGLYHAKRIAGFQGLSLDYNQLNDKSSKGEGLTRHQFALIFPPNLWRKKVTTIISGA